MSSGSRSSKVNTGSMVAVIDGMGGCEASIGDVDNDKTVSEMSQMTVAAGFDVATFFVGYFLLEAYRRGQHHFTG